MYVLKGFKGNKFREVDLPKNNDFFARLQGNFSVPNSSAYSGDSYLPNGLSKIDKLAAASKINERMLSEQDSNSE